MRKNQALETGRDRKALARDAGLGRISVASVLAGAFSGYGALAAMLAIVGLVAVAVNGGHDFSGLSGARFKDATLLTGVIAGFLAFVFGGYTAGRMSRRSGATNGVMAGIVGVILGALVVVVARAGGAGASLHRVAVHLNVPSTWTDWRNVGLAGAALSGAAMIVGGIVGGAAGERWHAKLLARAADSAYGPEAERLAEARKQAAEAASAHVAAQDRVARAAAAGEPVPAGSVSSIPGRPTVVDPPARTRAAAVSDTGGERTYAERGDAARTPEAAAADANAEARAADARATVANARAAETDTRAKPRRRHLLHH